MTQSILLSLLFILGSGQLSAACCGACVGESVPGPFGNGLEQNDYPIVMTNINSKRSIPLKDKGCSFSISGDVRTAWAHVTEKLKCCNIRQLGPNIPGITDNDADDCLCVGKDGKCSRFCFPRDLFEVQFNLYLDYVADRSWAVGWVTFDNAAGINSSVPCSLDNEACRGSGCCENLCMRKAYIGYNVVANGCFRFDIELGRRPLWSIFNSYIEFQNRFDGALFRFAYNVSDQSDLYLNCGPFVIDERAHHFGYVGEAGYLNIFNTGFDILYSFITWSKHGPNRCRVDNALGSRFDDSQLSINYWLNPDLLGVSMKFFGAGLVNTAAKANELTFGKKENWAWYAGVLIGRVCLAGDWSLNACYQYVQAQAIPDSDISGIGTGNALGEVFILATDPASARGMGNFQGWRFEGLYAITDNLSLDALVEFSSPIKKSIGGDHDFSLFRLQAIYAF